MNGGRSEVLGWDFGVEFIVRTERISSGVDEAGGDETEFGEWLGGCVLGSLKGMHEGLAVVEDGGLGGFFLRSGLTIRGGKELEGSAVGSELGMEVDDEGFASLEALGW